MEFDSILRDSLEDDLIRILNCASLALIHLLDRVQKRALRLLDNPESLVIDTLAYRRNVATLSVFFKCIFGNCSKELKSKVNPLKVFHSMH